MRKLVYKLGSWLVNVGRPKIKSTGLGPCDKCHQYDEHGHYFGGLCAVCDCIEHGDVAELLRIRRS